MRLLHSHESRTELNGVSCADRGTRGWTAPELYTQNLSPDQQKRSMITAKADVYGAGWVFFEVLCGLSPLLFREATTDDDHAASKAATTLCLTACK